MRDGVIDRNVARVNGWQREYQRAEDELDDPRSLALPSWEALIRHAAAGRSWAVHFAGGGRSSSSRRVPRPVLVRCPASAG